MSNRHRALRVVWTLSVCTALSLLGDATLYTVLPSQYAAAGVTVLQVGWLLSVNRLVRPPLNLVSGRLSRRLDPKLLYVGGLTLGFISTLGYGLKGGLLPLLAMRALWGVAWALIAVSAYSLVLDISTEDTRGRLAGIYHSFSYFGGAVGGMLGGFLSDALGFSRSMLILSACTLLGCLGALTLPRTKRQREPAISAATAAPSLAVRLRAAVSRLRRLDARLWLILWLNFADRLFFAGVFYSTFGYYLANVLGSELRLGTLVLGVASLTGLLLFVRNVLTVVMGPVLGYLSDLLGERTRVLLLGEVLGVAGLACFALGQSPWWVGIGVLTTGSSYAIVAPMLLAWMGDLTREGERGNIVGGFQTMGDLGSGLGPLIAYPLLAALGLPTVYLLSGAFLALTIPLILRARRDQRCELA